MDASVNDGPRQTRTISPLGALGGVALLLAVAVSPVTGVHAQTSDDVRAMLDRMERLERDIRDLNLQVSRGSAPAASGGAGGKAQPSAPQISADIAAAGPAVARIAVRMTALEDDLRGVTGAMEEVQFRLGEIRKRLDKLVGDVDYRLTALESRVGGAPGTPGAQGQPLPATPRVSTAPSPPPVAKIIPGAGGPGFAKPPGTLGSVSEKAVSALTPPATASAAAAPAAPAQAPAAAPAPAPAAQAARASVLPAGTVKQQYDFAFGLLRQANYDQAEVALQEFVRQHPKDPLTSNARYWLGETYYVRAAYVQAAEVFLEGYQTDPTGSKAPDSLLKLGMSLAGLDKKREACATFDKLIKEFPKANAGLKNTITREKQKSGCS
jgi:tol-pal system protein YbgF